MELVFTRQETWVEKWDLFLSECPRSSHLILSDWLKSYSSYGFDYEIGIALEDNKIIGGFGAVIPKFSFFKFYIIPHGLVYKNGYESYFRDHIEQIKDQANKLKCCYLQLSVPISSNTKIVNYSYSPKDLDFLSTILKKGKLFDYVYCSYGINWVDFNGVNDLDSFMELLTPKVRRNVRMPYNKGAVAANVIDEGSIKIGYNVIEDNARLANYAVREFRQFKPTILSLIKKDLAFFISCKVDGIVKAAGFFVKCGGYMTNITGGVLRHKPDIKLGYMLQWEAIKKSFELGFDGYNISMGGSPGVKDFKSRFKSEAIHFENPHYHLVLNSIIFRLFMFLSKYVKPNKAKIARILGRLK